MKGMNNLYDKENTLYQTENYKGGYLQLYIKDGKYFVEMNVKNGACKVFTNKDKAISYYCRLYDKYWR